MRRSREKLVEPAIVEGIDGPDHDTGGQAAAEHVLQIALTVWFRSRASRANEPARATEWILYSQWLQVTVLCTVAIWWSLWDFDRVPSPARERLLLLTSLKPTLTTLTPFVGKPLGALAIARLIAVASSRKFLATNWSATDLVKRLRRAKYMLDGYACQR